MIFGGEAQGFEGVPGILGGVPGILGGVPVSTYLAMRSLVWLRTRFT